MKIGSSVLLVLFFATTVLSQDISSVEIALTSQLLSTLTNKAIVDDRRDLVAVYYTAYQSIKTQHKTLVAYDEFFQNVALDHGLELGQWVVGFEYPPKEFQTFSHSQIPTGTNPCEKGTSPQGTTPVLKRTDRKVKSPEIKQ